jgi:hypothetical protein
VVEGDSWLDAGGQQCVDEAGVELDRLLADAVRRVAGRQQPRPARAAWRSGGAGEQGCVLQQQQGRPSARAKGESVMGEGRGARPAMLVRGGGPADREAVVL